MLVVEQRGEGQLSGPHTTPIFLADEIFLCPLEPSVLTEPTMTGYLWLCLWGLHTS